LSISQINYYDNGSLVVPDSEWGQLNVTYTPGASMEYLNVVENPGTSNAEWVVQNDPLLSQSSLGSSNPFTSGMMFDLGSTRGVPVSSLNIGYVFSSTPMLTAPVSYTNSGLVSVGQSQNIINSGVPSGDNTLNAPTGPLPLGVGALPLAPPAILIRTGMPNVTQELNFCGPGAAANSLHWLANKNGYNLTDTLLQTQTKLAQYMGNANNGNWDDTEIAGKEEYIQKNNLPLQVEYQGGVKVANTGPVTFAWLMEQMNAGQDVEIMTNTHWVVLSGYVDAGPDAEFLEYRDDPFQHGAATTVAEQAIIDSRYTWTQFFNGSANIGNGLEVIQTAVAESPTPEPATLVSFALGMLGVVFLICKRKRAASN
jgi:hypothetical protein